MGSNSHFYRDTSSKEKVSRAEIFHEQIEIINDSKIKECFTLAEVSYGYASGDNVYYYDYPYSSINEGMIVEAMNLATRGTLPKGVKGVSIVNENTYKNLDLEISKLFNNFNSKNNDKEGGYVLYEFIPSNDKTPIITDIKTNIDSADEDFLRKYFFIIYHCTVLSENFDHLFQEEPKLEKKYLTEDKRYLLYFNSEKTIKSGERKGSPEVITCAFISEKPRDKVLEYIEIKDHIYHIYNIIRQLRYVYSTARAYHELKNDLLKSESAKEKLMVGYNILHPLKHRLGNLSQMAQDLEEVSEENDFIDSTTKNTISMFANEVYGVQKFSELSYLSYFSSIHDLHSVYNEKESMGEFRFSSHNTLDFSTLLKNIFDKVKRGKLNSNVDYRLDMKNGFFSISPYYTVFDKKIVRLKDYIYESIIFEIINNYSDHGCCDNNVKLLSIRFEGKGSIVFSNKSNCNNSEIDYQRSAGGLAFICKTLETTSAGEITQNVVNGCYEITLNLKGLECLKEK